MQQIHHSSVRFCPDPSDDTQFLLLGLLIGFRTEKFWAIGLAMRGSLPIDIMERLNPLSQGVVVHRAAVMKALVETHMESGDAPEEILSAVVRDNATALSMTPVASEEVDLSVNMSEASLGKLAEEYILALLREPRIADATGRHGAALPPPWMSGIQLWFRPNFSD